jgi:hypothetical protein
LFYHVAEDNSDNLFYLNPLSSIPASIADTISSYFRNHSNQIEHPGLSADEFPYDILPVNTVYNDLAEYPETWYEKVSYKGAFGSRNWLESWSLLWKDKIIE